MKPSVNLDELDKSIKKYGIKKVMDGLIHDIISYFSIIDSISIEDKIFSALTSLIATIMTLEKLDYMDELIIFFKNYILSILESVED